MIFRTFDCMSVVFVISKSSARVIEELQRNIIEIESKYKAELSRLKKKYESDLREYEIQIESLARTNGELAKANKSLSTRVKVCAEYFLTYSSLL